MEETEPTTGFENHNTGIRDFHLAMKSSDTYSNIETSTNNGRTLSTQEYQPGRANSNSPGRANNIDSKTSNEQQSAAPLETKETKTTTTTTTTTTNNNNSNNKEPWRTWFANTGGKKTNSAPLIPEPEFPRIAPTGTGISLRPYDIPPASLENIRNACNFYELKSSGKYSSKTLVGRYIFQLSREVQRQVVALEKADKAKTRRIEYLEDLVRNWEETFGHPSDEDLEKVFNTNDNFSPVLSPGRLASLLRIRLNENEKLKDDMNSMLRTRQDDIDRAEKAIADHFKATREQFRRDSDRLHLEIETARKNAKEENENNKINNDKNLAMMTTQMKKAGKGLLQKERNEIDQVVQAKVKQGLKDAITTSNKAIMETEAARRNHATEYLRKLSDVQKREQMVDGRLMGMKERHAKEAAGLKARYARLLKDTRDRMETSKQQKETAVNGMETENAWLRQRVADLQEMVVAFQDAMVL